MATVIAPLKATVIAPLNPGVVVRVRDLHATASLHVPDQTLRVIGCLERYDPASAIAILTDCGASLRCDLEHLRELQLRLGSLFEFVGELQVHPLSKELTLKARVGRNMDGLDLKLFDKVLEYRRQYQGEFRSE